MSLGTQDTPSGTSQFESLFFYFNVYSFMGRKGKIKKKEANSRLRHADGCTPLALCSVFH